MSSIWSEIRNLYQEEDIIYVDAFLTEDDNEEGMVIAEINVRTFEVKYLDERAKTDVFAQNVIKETIEQLKFTTEECPHCHEEVKLLSEYIVQACPECGKEILPCSICERDKYLCSECPLEKEMNKQPVVDAVIEELKKNFAVGDYTVLEELLLMIPKANLIMSLPEEEWSKYQ